MSFGSCAGEVAFTPSWHSNTNEGINLIVVQTTVYRYCCESDIPPINSMSLEITLKVPLMLLSLIMKNNETC